MSHRGGRGGDSPDPNPDELGNRIRREMREAGDSLEIAEGLPIILVKIQRRKYRRVRVINTIAAVFLFAALLFAGYTVGYATHKSPVRFETKTIRVATPGAGCPR